MKHTTKRIAVTMASAVMAVVALTVPVSTAVLHGRNGVPEHKKEIVDDSNDEEPPIRYGDDGALLIFDDMGLDRHMLVIKDDAESWKDKQPDTDETRSIGGPASAPLQTIDGQDLFVTDPDSNQIQLADTVTKTPVTKKETKDTLKSRRKTDRLKTNPTEAEPKSPPEQTTQPTPLPTEQVTLPTEPMTPTTESTTPTVTEQPDTHVQTVTEAEQNQSAGKYLIELKNPDKNYVGRPLQVKDRQYLEGLVMGEFGNDYLGSVLVAQCIRDSMVKSGTNSAAVIKRKYGYTAPVRKRVTQDVKRAVAFVFDEGGSGVQHPIYYFYASNLVRGRWHETQKFVVQRKAVRFFSTR